MWLFEEPEFREWFVLRHDSQNDYPFAAPSERCLSCGTELALVPYSTEATCGFCLAYEFGTFTQEDRLAQAVTGFGQIITSDDGAAFRRLYRHVLEDVLDSAKAVEGNFD